jgi:hypothetical protein
MYKGSSSRRRRRKTQNALLRSQASSTDSGVEKRGRDGFMAVWCRPSAHVRAREAARGARRHVGPLNRRRLPRRSQRSASTCRSRGSRRAAGPPAPVLKSPTSLLVYPTQTPPALSNQSRTPLPLGGLRADQTPPPSRAVVRLRPHSRQRGWCSRLHARTRQPLRPRGHQSGRGRPLLCR